MRNGLISRHDGQTMLSNQNHNFQRPCNTTAGMLLRTFTQRSDKSSRRNPHIQNWIWGPCSDCRIMGAQVHLHNIWQDRDEAVSSFGARLRGQAGVCKFTIQCPGCAINVNYADEILRDVLTRGIANTDIHPDLLGNKNQDMTLEEVFEFVEAKESGKPSIPIIRLPLSWCCLQHVQKN